MSNSTHNLSTTNGNVWIEEFNRRVMEFSQTIEVDFKKVQEVLSELGVDGKTEDSIEMLDSDDVLPMGDLFEAFVDSGLTKKAKLRLGVKSLRGRTESQVVKTTINDPVVNSIANLVKATRSKEDWSDEELMKAYDIDNPAVCKIISARARGRHCIIFNEDGTVNQEVSLRLLKLSKKQPTSQSHDVNGNLVKVYRPGQFIAEMLDESPLAFRQVLVEGRCPVTDTDWSGVRKEARVFARVHFEYKLKGDIRDSEARHLAEDAKGGLPSLKAKYRKTALIYMDLEERDMLPKLRILSKETIGTTVMPDTGF